MGKKRPIVVISSSDDDENLSRNRSSSRSKSTSRSAASSKGSRRGASSKKLNRGVYDSPSLCEAEATVKFESLSEEFGECLRDFGVLSGFKYTKMKEMWVDKHKPRSFVELAVHKKKVEEVKQWLEERVRMPEEGYSNSVLVITGQAGVGKSATMHLIASQLRAELYEWTTPTPTLWQEHVHNSSGIRYRSKLDEFEAFSEKIGKYRLLSALVGGPRKPIIVLIDDLPMTNGRIAFARLIKCLTNLIRSCKIPTVILITEYRKTESVDNSRNFLEELESTLERSGAHKVAFNPLTVNSIKKALLRICNEEKCDVSAEWIDHIAKASGGDIRHAITSLQYLCLRPEDACSKPMSTLGSIQSGTKDELSSLTSSSLALGMNFTTVPSHPFGRDETLTLFHALGKFLHNKRETDVASAHGHNSLVLQEKFTRKPLKMDDPENVLSQAHGQATKVADFLHENVLDFISDEAIDDVWLVTSYLCDADFLLASSFSSTKSCMTSELYESGSLSQSVAASVAVRGVLFGNSHPSPSRWHTIRSPKLWQIDQLERRNKSQMATEIFEDIIDSPYIMSNRSFEYAPTIKWLRSNLKTSAVHSCPRENSLQFSEGEEDDLDWSNEEKLGGYRYSNETEDDDDIEDW